MEGMCKVTPFEAYSKYLSYSMHFSNNNYDYFKYGGKVKTSERAFDVRKDKYQFYKLSKHKDLDGFLLSHFMFSNSKKTWVGDMISNEVESHVYLDWSKRIQALSYVFSEDINKMDDEYNNNFLCLNNKAPQLFRMLTRKEVTYETVIIINAITPFFDEWDRLKFDTFIWGDLRKKLDKYAPFLSFDKDKYKELLLKRFT